MNLLRKFARLVQGDKYDFRDRQFIMLTGMIEVGLFIVLIADSDSGRVCRCTHI